MFLFNLRAEYDSGSLALKEQLCNHFGDICWEFRYIRAVLDDIGELYFDVVSQIHIGGW
ncbi:hypothetical protein [Mycobacterium leprae]|uniref:hypothetical protein n=1 Tax=Mycobacterium leprae TaxID=1769 RepID=UPI000312E862